MRVRGSRDPDLSRMKPSDVSMLTSTSKMTAASEFQTSAFSAAAMTTRFEVTYYEKETPSGG